MRLRCVLALTVSCLALIASTADAQPARRVGVTLGYPAGVGVLWHVTDGIALRPDVVLTRSVTDTTTTPFAGGVSNTSSQTDWTTSAGLSVLFTVRDIDRLRLYGVPRLAYLRSESSTDGLTGLGTIESSTDGVLASGSLGAQYGLGDRAAVFGEAGVQYQRQTFESAIGTARSKATLSSVGLRSAVGLVIYF